MKKVTFIMSFLILGLFACSQAPPKTVSDSFAKKFSKAEKVKWEQEEENEWEAEFIINGQEMTACFDNAGKWLETEGEVEVKDLPAEVIKAIQLEFNGFEIEGAESIENPDFTGYEMMLEKSETRVEITVNNKGELTIQKVTVGEDEDEGDKQENEETEENEKDE